MHQKKKQYYYCYYTLNTMIHFFGFLDFEANGTFYLRLKDGTKWTKVEQLISPLATINLFLTIFKQQQSV